MANWRFGSLFRNSIPPPRQYKVPTFEEIFETDHSNPAVGENEEPQKVVLNLNPSLGGKQQNSQKQQKNLFRFSNLLTEHNRNSLTNNPVLSEALSKFSKKDYLQEAFFETETTTKSSLSSTLSYEDMRKQKLIEMAKEELRKKQQLKDQKIKAEQKQNKFLKIMSQQKLTKAPRSQELDNFFSKVKDFDNKSILKKKLSHELIKQYHDKLIKKSDQKQHYQDKL